MVTSTPSARQPVVGEVHTHVGGAEVVGAAASTSVDASIFHVNDADAVHGNDGTASLQATERMIAWVAGQSY